jgi:hypothetical protein
MSGDFFSRENANPCFRPHVHSIVNLPAPIDWPSCGFKPMKETDTNLARWNVAILTIVSNNYLHFARTMIQSAKAHHPNARFYCVVVDKDLSPARALVSEFETISLEELNLPFGDEFAFQYSILELNTAVKPWAIEYILSQQHDVVFYIDPDIYFYSSMGDAESELRADVDILFTPHLLAPMTDGKTPSELDIRRAGAFNLGFCAVKNSHNTRTFLQWWKQKLTRHCSVDLESGIFVDQGWIDLVPGMFENVGILRNAGYNVAYWNLAQRPITKGADGNYRIGAMPLVFFHFSGLNVFDSDVFSKHQNRFTKSSSGLATELFEAYARALVMNGASEYAKLEYGFGRFASGDAVPNEVRSMFRSSEAVRTRFGLKPFDNPAAMNDPFDEWKVGELSPTIAMVALWRGRQDLKAAFPMKSVRSIRDFYRWFVNDPELRRHFSADVVAYHRGIVEKWASKKSGSISRDQMSGLSAKGARRLSRLYTALLNRSADPEGFLSYGDTCRSRFGYIRAWRSISMSPESRAMPHLLSRMVKALLRSG